MQQATGLTARWLVRYAGTGRCAQDGARLAALLAPLVSDGYSLSQAETKLEDAFTFLMKNHDEKKNN